MRFKSPILKLALFATGLSGIVAEYILSTLAAYFIGDSVFQWTMIVSIMLFSMGVGSRLSQYIEGNLLTKFIYIEFGLSFLVSFSSLIVYSSSTYFNAPSGIVFSMVEYSGVIIYLLSILIGILIGMEIPMVIRLNDQFESLKVNIASVMELDYFGSLVGGFLYAFIGLPIIGLTYTPFILGSINLAVAVVLFFSVKGVLDKPTKNRIIAALIPAILVIGTGVFVAQPIVSFGEQKKYKDKIVYTHQSKYQKLVITQWKNDYWLYINGNQQFSTLDEDKYHEPLVHPVMQLSRNPKDVLILGGGDGCAAREILKYQKVESITLVDLDPEMTRLGKEHPVLTEVNQGALNHEKVKVINKDGYKFLESTKDYYDIIIIDLPDPKTVELSRLYSYEYYKLCYKQLRPNGLVITQAGSPYYATNAFLCIDKTMTEAGFQTAMLHNHVITLGEWGWILGSKSLEKENLKSSLKALTFENVETRWINHDAMALMTSFGKDIYFKPSDSVAVNRIQDAVLYRYYLKGNWDLY